MLINESMGIPLSNEGLLLYSLINLGIIPLSNEGLVLCSSMNTLMWHYNEEQQYSAVM
jgi:hypothetical protein